MRPTLPALALLLLPAAALAHVTLDPPAAPAGTYVRVALRVPHGCGGAATTGITVTIPDGVYMAKPMPKPGWRLAVEHRPLDGGVAAQGHRHAREAGEMVVARIRWEGGRLPDEQYEEFVMLLQAPDAPGEVLALPVLQDCEGGRSDAWAEQPAPGHAGHDLARPAPTLRLTPR